MAYQEETTNETTYEGDMGIVQVHEALSAQLQSLAEDITQLESKLKPILSLSMPDVVETKAAMLTRSDLHERATKMTEEVTYLRSRVIAIIERIEL